MENRININNQEYTLYLKNEDRSYPSPHIIDEDGNVPKNQKKLLREFLSQNGQNVDEEWNTHQFIRKTIEVLENKALKPVTVPEEVEAEEENKNLLKLTLENIRRIHKNVLDDEKYGKEFNLVSNVLNCHPSNDNIDFIAMKASVIDVTNSTQLSKYKSRISLVDVAKIIMDIPNIDSRIKNGDPNVVSEIASATRNVGGEGNGVNLFSFASKYCHYHNLFVYGKDDYSIFDSVVCNTLGYYAPWTNKNEISKLRREFKYKEFNDCIAKVLDAAGITEAVEPQRRTMFDHFLWYANRSNQNK